MAIKTLSPLQTLSQTRIILLQKFVSALRFLPTSAPKLSDVQDLERNPGQMGTATTYRADLVGRWIF